MDWRNGSIFLYSEDTRDMLVVGEVNRSEVEFRGK